MNPLDPACVLPPRILGIEIKFLCTMCEKKLMIDFRWQGVTINCPACGRELCVPELGGAGEMEAPGDGEQLPPTRLSSEEVAFLSVSFPSG